MIDAKTEVAELRAVHLEFAFERGVDLVNRTVRISGDIDSDTFHLIDAALTELESISTKAITVRINSQGGDPYDAMAVVGRMKASKCNIITEAYGAVMSAAIAILAGGDKRRASSLTWAMHHQSSYDITGRHKDMAEFVAQQGREEKMWSAFMADHSSQDADWWMLQAKKGDKYLTAEDLLEHGVVDEII